METKKTETAIRFEAYLKQGYYLIEKQKFDVAFATELMAICENLFVHYGQILKARDNWKKKYYDLKGNT